MPPPLKIAIAGAGTAGLAAAAFLTRDGHDVRLIEKFEAPRPLGAGLMLQPTGLACLACLGLDQSAIARGQAIAGIRGTTVRGAKIFDVGYRELGPHLFGVGIHRGTLFRLLYDEVVRLGVPIMASTEVKETRAVAGGRLLIDTRGGAHGPFDLVIDGTGMRSPLRAKESRVRLDRPYPYGAVWGILEQPADWFAPGWLMQVYDGCGLMIGVLPVGRRPGDERPLVALFWSLRVKDYPTWRSTGVAAWKAQVSEAWPQAASVVAQVRTHDDMTFASYADIVVRPCFAERLVFIGDAGRATSPQLGQGANLALIDAATLAASLRETPSVAAALAAYAARRRAHTRFYSVASRTLTPFFQSDSKLAGAVRDATFPLFAYVPYLRREMVRTLSGMKTGLFSSLDPGIWHARYALHPAPVLSSQPA
ncbi:MAG TPA: NAD(P)/FAD-dependent oxidoreductase [Hyphomicrobiaceae bacterium]|nr:NAD(P)/FAD-dependent oxidoreductase [Hyphomicrobiaceae bacterium]